MGKSNYCGARRPSRIGRATRALIGPAAVSAVSLLLPALTFGGPLLLIWIWDDAPVISEGTILVISWLTFAELVAAGCLLLPMLAGAAHVVGHLVAGRLVGFRLQYTAVGPLQVTATARGLRLGLNRSWRAYWGTVRQAPDAMDDIPRRMARVAGGGPLASLLFALTLLAVDGWAGGPFILHFLVLRPLAIFSLAFAIGSRLPCQAGGMVTDGATIALARADVARAERQCALSALRGAIEQGRRPADWPAAWLAAATSAEGGPDEAVSWLLAYCAALDGGNATDAADHLDRALMLHERLPRRIRPLLLTEGAYITAWSRGDSAAAQRMLDEAGDAAAGRHPWLRLRTEAAILLQDGATAEARARASAGLEQLALARGLPLARGRQRRRSCGNWSRRRWLRH